MRSSLWITQFRACLAKNRKLLVRRPIHLTILLLSSVVSVIFAWLAGRDARGPQGEFPPLNECGQVDAEYYNNITDWTVKDEIPISLNEAWRSGLAVFLLSFGPMATAISAFLILRDELVSQRWGYLRSAGLADSAHWLAWLVVFVAPTLTNSLAGAITAIALPNVHALSAVNFGSVFAILWFLNMALVSSSFFLAALCGTISSATLTVFVIIGMIVASSAPVIGTSASMGQISASGSTQYGGHPVGSGGAFWAHGSTETTIYNDFYEYDEQTGDRTNVESTARNCQDPIVQNQEFYTTSSGERDKIPKDGIFQGCYFIAGTSTFFAQSKASFLFWYFVPQTHIMMAFSNILGYTALPGNIFSFSHANKSPEVLAQEALLNYKGGMEPLYDPNATNGTSLFPQGSTIISFKTYPPYDPDPYAESKSNCPSTYVSDLCYDGGYSNCNTPSNGYPSSSSPSVNDCIGFLASLVVIYSLLAAYFLQIFPMMNGSAMKFYSPLLPSYWLGSRGGVADGSDEEEGGVGECGSAEGQIGVKAVNVSKKYGKINALRPFSIDMRVGEVTALLGHNGAGKSTFANILCCEQSSSGGDILVFGRSVCNDQHTVRRMVGECKQDDYLWPNLSGREHLEILGGVRGINQELGLGDIVQKCLESLDLDLVADMYSSAFSGGMKRRLSVAMATIGDAPVVVLDEPTTGMDPVSRRFVWKHIDSIKRGRVILLTTHAMEEADLLSDTVAIMCAGTLAAIGTPLELKTKHGSALQFSLISDKENTKTVEEKIKAHFANALMWVDIKTSDSGYVSLNIKKICNNDDDGGEGVPASNMSDFIGWLEEADSPVAEYGFSNSSLEEVFLAVTQQQSSSVANEDLRVERSCCCRKRRKPLVSETVTVVDESDITVHQSKVDFTQQPKSNISDYARILSTKTQTLALIRFSVERNWLGRPSIINWVIYSCFCGISMITGFGIVEFWQSEAMYLFLDIQVLLLSLPILSIIAPIYSDRNANDRNDGLFKMMRMQGMLDKSFLLGTSLYSFTVQFAYAFVFLTLFFATHIFRDAETPDCRVNNDGYAIDDATFDYDCGYARFGSKPTISPYSRIEVLSGTYQGNDVSVYAHQASGGYEMIIGIIFVFASTFPGTVLVSSFLPGNRLPLIGVSIILLLACVSPAIIYLSNILDYDFFEQCLETTDDIYNCTQNDFSLDSVTSDFVHCVGVQINLPAMGIYCSPSYASLLPQIGLFHTLALTLMSDIVFYSEPKEYVSEVLFPRLDATGASCSGNSCRWSYGKSMYSGHLGYMFLGAVLLLILGIAMAYTFLFPSGFIVRLRHKIGNAFKSEKRREHHASETIKEVKELAEVNVEREQVRSIIQPFLAQTIDDEENDQSNPVLSLSNMSNREELSPVLMYKLRKVFPSLGRAPPKVALKSFDLHVSSGEVLGLLGKNGAGKTTALKILSGMHSATSGIGLVAGYDVELEQTQAYENLGNCQQFDCVWRDQSVQRHLEFFSRLKGIDNPTSAAKEIATAVGLGSPEVYSRPAGKLSGGMRRRLSIAVSLLGSPKVLLLDEPTTGLDPSTRNEIWGLVSSFATPERAIIITTHMMIEADTLCSRIAIVAKGSLKVVGTNQHLKDKYGSGYLLQLNLAHSNEESIASALQYVKSNIHEEAKLATKQAKTIHMNLPRDVNIQKIFTTMYSSDSEANGGINQFLVSQSSLEDVFISLGE